MFKIGDKVYCVHHGIRRRLLGNVVGFRSGNFVEGRILVDWHVDGFDPIPYNQEDLRLAENGIQRAKRIINV